MGKKHSVTLVPGVVPTLLLIVLATSWLPDQVSSQGEEEYSMDKMDYHRESKPVSGSDGKVHRLTDKGDYYNSKKHTNDQTSKSKPYSDHTIGRDKDWFPKNTEFIKKPTARPAHGLPSIKRARDMKRMPFADGGKKKPVEQTSPWGYSDEEPGVGGEEGRPDRPVKGGSPPGLANKSNPRPSSGGPTKPNADYLSGGYGKYAKGPKELNYKKGVKLPGVVNAKPPLGKTPVTFRNRGVKDTGIDDYGEETPVLEALPSKLPPGDPERPQFNKPSPGKRQPQFNQTISGIDEPISMKPSVVTGNKQPIDKMPVTPPYTDEEYVDYGIDESEGSSLGEEAPVSSYPPSRPPSEDQERPPFNEPVPVRPPQYNQTNSGVDKPMSMKPPGAAGDKQPVDMTPVTPSYTDNEYSDYGIDESSSSFGEEAPVLEPIPSRPATEYPERPPFDKPLPGKQPQFNQTSSGFDDPKSMKPPAVTGNKQPVDKMPVNFPKPNGGTPNLDSDVSDSNIGEEMPVSRPVPSMPPFGDPERPQSYKPLPGIPPQFNQTNSGLDRPMSMKPPGAAGDKQPVDMTPETPPYTDNEYMDYGIDESSSSFGEEAPVSEPIPSRPATEYPERPPFDKPVPGIPSFPPSSPPFGDPERPQSYKPLPGIPPQSNQTNSGFDRPMSMKPPEAAGDKQPVNKMPETPPYTDNEYMDYGLDEYNPTIAEEPVSEPIPPRPATEDPEGPQSYKPLPEMPPQTNGGTANPESGVSDSSVGGEMPVLMPLPSTPPSGDPERPPFDKPIPGILPQFTQTKPTGKPEPMGPVWKTSDSKDSCIDYGLNKDDVDMAQPTNEGCSVECKTAYSAINVHLPTGHPCIPSKRDYSCLYGECMKNGTSMLSSMARLSLKIISSTVYNRNQKKVYILVRFLREGDGPAESGRVLCMSYGTRENKLWWYHRCQDQQVDLSGELKFELRESSEDRVLFVGRLALADVKGSVPNQLIEVPLLEVESRSGLFGGGLLGLIKKKIKKKIERISKRKQMSKVSKKSEKSVKENKDTGMVMDKDKDVDNNKNKSDACNCLTPYLPQPVIKLDQPSVESPSLTVVVGYKK